MRQMQQKPHRNATWDTLGGEGAAAVTAVRANQR
jgi:hypothetical protein